MQAQDFSSSADNAYIGDSEGRTYPDDEALGQAGYAIMNELLDVMLGSPLEEHLGISKEGRKGRRGFPTRPYGGPVSYQR